MSTRYCSGIVVIAALVFPAVVRGQSAVEYGTSAARSSATSAPAKGVGKSVGSIFEGVQKRLQGAESGAQGQVKPVAVDVVPASPGTKITKAPAPTPAVKLGTACVEEPGKIAAGMPYDELISVCGTPAMVTVEAAGGKKLLYTAGPKDLVVVVSDGKVESVKSAQRYDPLDVVVLR